MVGDAWPLPQQEIPRKESDVLVEQFLSDAIKKFNIDIMNIPDRIDEIIYKLLNFLKLSNHQ